MAYFIIIGTDNDVKGVVDEVRKNTHSQHNVVTTGCIVEEDDGVYYHWDVFNNSGVKTKDGKESTITLHTAFTNQISQFKSLLHDGSLPNVLVVSKCFNEDDCDRLISVCKELYNIDGAVLGGIILDIVLIGYDINNSANVATRPDWKILKTIRGLGTAGDFHTKILYINNMDFKGAATNVDQHVLSRFLSHWAKMISASTYNPKNTVNTLVYSIGLAEHQYDFSDLSEFFKLAAEEKYLDRKLNATPSADTQQILDFKYFKKIDIDAQPWIDGLCQIQKMWSPYCATEWDPSKPIRENEYSVVQQELIIAEYLNLYLKLFIKEEQRKIDILIDQKEQKKSEKRVLSERLSHLNELPDDDDTKAEQIAEIDNEISHLDSKITECESQIKVHEDNIDRNTFIDADTFHKEYGTMTIVTGKDKKEYESNKAKVGELIDRVKTDEALEIMRGVVADSTINELDKLINLYPEYQIINIGYVENQSKHTTEKASTTSTLSGTDQQSERSGCLLWFKQLFARKKAVEDVTPQPVTNPIVNEDEMRKLLKGDVGKCVNKLKEAEEVHKWWSNLCRTIETDKERKAECRHLMDGEKDALGNYVEGRRGYNPQKYTKSVSLINMAMVRNFRDSDPYYENTIKNFIDSWFNKSSWKKQYNATDLSEMIQNKVIDEFAKKYHTLKWDGSNPFVNENISDNEMHDIISYNIKQSKPFVEFVRIQDTNLDASINRLFYYNNSNIPTNPNIFNSQFDTTSIIPVYLEEFTNSLCVVQVMEIPGHIEAIRDFKPRREAQLHPLATDITQDVYAIIGEANTAKEKALKIYNWLCDNIAYDTTKQIHDADTCYRRKIGVCQAYCELFCYMAEKAGVTAEIVTGYAKDASGTVSEEEKHSWLYVYTDGYDGIFIEPTWGAGSVNKANQFVKSTDNSIWFDVKPEWMAYTHYPDDTNWLNLDSISEKLTLEVFKQLPYVLPSQEPGINKLASDIANRNKDNQDSQEQQ